MEVITLKWFSKRYRGYDTRVVASVDFDDLQFVDTHMCKMFVEFTTGESVTLTAMVRQNHINKTWTANGIDTNGNQVAVRFPAQD
ncbi:MAG: hypothetical protein CMN60_21095 [Sphingobium sp.]|nr:hypothetical protein [Sphingobium sp.]MBS50128.1 hypothetical protein [Sphingobium sp.]|tara:strand:- start:1085 stop:1339 length:255 start_codon:yes stop_codon:yes gene_type:complete